VTTRHNPYSPGFEVSVKTKHPGFSVVGAWYRTDAVVEEVVVKSFFVIVTSGARFRINDWTTYPPTDGDVSACFFKEISQFFNISVINVNFFVEVEQVLHFVNCPEQKTGVVCKTVIESADAFPISGYVE
jgi:hypothetical protein